MQLAKEFYPELNNEDFFFFKEVLHELTGITLSSSKKELVKSRIRNHVQSLGFGSYTEYRRHLSKIGPDHSEWQVFINFFTTNKTDFFREFKHFDYIQTELIPDWIDKKQRGIKLWCCAASTGQEPYTLSMVLLNSLPSEIAFKILATDIDTDVLQKCRNGVYSINKINEIPKNYRDLYVNIGKAEVQGWFRVSDQVRDPIEFKYHNLIDPSNPEDNVFDLIFCRNVLIYFTPDTIYKLMRKLHHALKKNGLLFIGHSESISNCSDIFRMIQPSIYQKV